MTAPIYALEVGELTGKTVVITGAGFDLGKALALDCAAYGATVVLLDKDNRALEAVYDQMLEAGGPEPIISELDLNKFNADIGNNLCQQLVECCGCVDVLIHTANWAFPLSPLAVYDDLPWDKAMRVLHQVPLQLTRSLLPALNLAKSPRVVFNLHHSSGQSKAYWGAYAVAHAALKKTAEVWADELENKGFGFYTVNAGVLQSTVRVKHFPGEDQSTLTANNDASVLALFHTALSQQLVAHSRHFSSNQ